MIDLYLRADTEAALAEALEFLRDGDEWKARPDYSLDLIGPVVTTPAQPDEAGDVVTEAVIDQRFHANLRCEPNIAAQVPDSIIIQPDSPLVVWF